MAVCKLICRNLADRVLQVPHPGEIVYGPPEILDSIQHRPCIEIVCPCGRGRGLCIDLIILPCLPGISKYKERLGYHPVKPRAVLRGDRFEEAGAFLGKIAVVLHHEMALCDIVCGHCRETSVLDRPGKFRQRLGELPVKIADIARHVACRCSIVGFRKFLQLAEAEPGPVVVPGLIVAIPAHEKEFRTHGFSYRPP